MTSKFLLALALTIAAPFIGGLVTGIDRKITARLQSRYGPPIAQPFYDVLKLLGKDRMVVNMWQALCPVVTLTASALCVFLFGMQADLLLIFFVLTVGGVFLIMGAMAAPSPYSQIGAQRELMQMLAYEPLLILVFVSFSMVTGSFKIADVYAYGRPLLPQLPLMFIVLGYALTIKLRKSPFDIAACHHAHQEIVRGVLTEYSGPNLALIEIAHWFDVALILGLCSLFWSTSALGAATLLAGAYFLELVIDNVTARMTWRFMLQNALGVGLALSVLNIVWQSFNN
ncbi:MAG: NADH-quinone oxidoreductase subunit H [Desulfovibrionaceae bacterium]|nr:NADH-quinone oxidoreductase subunit H [Desulfovibrionaceae bacterium]MBF0514943.1 NADH-quinone oxidoreductase subunit H [Desulfovibrionaceae bacterium]